MTFNLDDETLKRAAAQMRKSAQKIHTKMVYDEIFGTLPSSISVSTARMAPSVVRSPLPFSPLTQLFDVVTSPHIVEPKTLSRERKRGFWRRLWDGLTDLNPWPYSRIEYYKAEVPAIVIDKGRNKIICHPSLKNEIEKAVRSGTYDVA